MSFALYFGIYVAVCFAFYKWAEYRIVIPKWCEYLMILNIFFWIVGVSNAYLLRGAVALKN